MKINNKTKYDTRYLKKLFLACEKHCFQVYLQHGNPKHRHVTIKTHRTTWVGGYAWYNSTSIVIKLPPPVSAHLGHIKKENKISARSVAQVYLHEIAHNLGKKHKDMIPSKKIDVTWWPDEFVPLKTIKEKLKPNIIELRAAHAQKKLSEWQSKAKRAKTFIKKYQRKVKYYEGKMAAYKEVEKCKLEQS